MFEDLEIEGLFPEEDEQSTGPKKIPKIQNYFNTFNKKKVPAVSKEENEILFRLDKLLKLRGAYIKGRTPYRIKTNKPFGSYKEELNLVLLNIHDDVINIYYTPEGEVKDFHIRDRAQHFNIEAFNEEIDNEVDKGIRCPVCWGIHFTKGKCTECEERKVVTPLKDTIQYKKKRPLISDLVKVVDRIHRAKKHEGGLITKLCKEFGLSYTRYSYVRKTYKHLLDESILPDHMTSKLNK